MGKFTPTVKHETEFDGEHVTVVFARLKRQDFYTLAPHMKVNEDGESVMQFQDNVKMSEALTPILKKYIKEIHGLTDAAGVPISIEQLCEEMYFVPLLGDVISALFAASRLSEEDAKNSGGQPGDTSKGSTSLAG